MSEKIDVVDFVISVLKDHERELDKVINKLAMLLKRQEKIHREEMELLKTLLEKVSG